MNPDVSLLSIKQSDVMNGVTSLVEMVNNRFIPVVPVR